VRHGAAIGDPGFVEHRLRLHSSPTMLKWTGHTLLTTSVRPLRFTRPGAAREDAYRPRGRLVIEAVHVDIGLRWQVPLMGLFARVLKSVGTR
jgi:hypothetical protein